MDGNERERLGERGTVLAAMLAAAERLHELVDVVKTAPTGDAALARVAALLGWEESVARTVLGMPLDAASPGRQGRLRSELDEVRRLLA